jgi:hypothetical protein
MAVEARPTWDPTGTLSVSVDCDRRAVLLRLDGQRTEFVLRTERPERFGWERRTPPRRRVAVTEVVAHCLREWDAEREVLAISEQAAREAGRRGAAWRPAAKRLSAQVRTARQGRRMSVLPFQLLWHELAKADGGQRVSLSTAALRAGFRQRDGRGDTNRLERRLGLRPSVHGNGHRSRNGSVNYATGVALCRALGRDPAEFGL